MAATEVPKKIGPYEILGPLGKGGMGAVYKAMQPSLNRIVAIKVLPADFAKDPDSVARFHREAQTVAMLSHPNIVQIIDKGEDQGILYFAMEYVEGTSLDVVLRQRRLSLQEVVQIIKQIGRGLGAAHRAGVVHRDLNPRNILVSPTLTVVKLADFGISRVESVTRNLGTLSTRDMTLGSLHYLAPEQAVDASAVDHRADIYSLGVVFYEALTGRMPLGKFSLPSELNKDLPSEIDPVVLKCLATEPDNRYATVGLLLEDIDKLEEMMRFQLLDELKGLKRGTSMLFKKGSTSFQRNRGLLVLFGLLAVALVGVGAWMLLEPAEESPAAAGAPLDPAAKPAAADASTAPTAPADSPAVASAGGGCSRVGLRRCGAGGGRSGTRYHGGAAADERGEAGQRAGNASEERRGGAAGRATDDARRQAEAASQAECRSGDRRPRSRARQVRRQALRAGPGRRARRGHELSGEPGGDRGPLPDRPHAHQPAAQPGGARHLRRDPEPVQERPARRGGGFPAGEARAGGEQQEEHRGGEEALFRLRGELPDLALVGAGARRQGGDRARAARDRP